MIHVHSLEGNVSLKLWLTSGYTFAVYCFRIRFSLAFIYSDRVGINLLKYVNVEESNAISLLRRQRPRTVSLLSPPISSSTLETCENLICYSF
jgi:hypothetical protein